MHNQPHLPVWHLQSSALRRGEPDVLRKQHVHRIWLCLQHYFQYLQRMRRICWATLLQFQWKLQLRFPAPMQHHCGSEDVLFVRRS